MKKNFFCAFILFSLFACNSDSSKEKKEETSTTTSSDNSSSSSSSSSANPQDEAQKRIEELKKIPTISNDALKSFFPEEVMGMKRSSFSVNNMTGYAMGTAEYKKDDTTRYQVMIYDCAGEAGSAFYGMSYLAALNMEREDENGYEKTVKYMGTKAIEVYNKGSNSYTESFLTGERFWVSLMGDNTGLDNLKSFADALDLDKLKSLK